MASKPHLSLVATDPPEEVDDATLVRALQQDQPRAPRLAWERFAPTVARSLGRLLGPERSIEDVTQEVFLRFFRKVGDLRDPGAVRPFLFGICLRVVRREVRGRWLRRWLHLTDDGVLPDVAATADDLEAREALRRYYALVDRLGGGDRSLFVARQIEGLELGEVARAHGLSVSTVQRRLRRATRRMAAMVAADPLLAGFGEPGGPAGGPR